MGDVYSSVLITCHDLQVPCSLASLRPRHECNFLLIFPPQLELKCLSWLHCGPFSFSGALWLTPFHSANMLDVCSLPLALFSTPCFLLYSSIDSSSRPYFVRGTSVLSPRTRRSVRFFWKESNLPLLDHHPCPWPIADLAMPAFPFFCYCVAHPAFHLFQSIWLVRFLDAFDYCLVLQSETKWV